MFPRMWKGPLLITGDLFCDGETESRLERGNNFEGDTIYPLLIRFWSASIGYYDLRHQLLAR
jgi:hypothetical protein